MDYPVILRYVKNINYDSSETEFENMIDAVVWVNKHCPRCFNKKNLEYILINAVIEMKYKKRAEFIIPYAEDSIGVYYIHFKNRY